MKYIMMVLILIIILAPEYTGAKSTAEKDIVKLIDKDITLLHTWTVYNKDFKNLICICYKPDGNTDSSIVIYKRIKNKLIKVYRSVTGGFTYSIIESDGNLVTIWETATGYLIYVYSYNNGVIQKCFDDGSNLQPDNVYLSQIKKRLIIVPILEWTLNTINNDRERIPVAANVYIWKGKSYYLYEKVPWADRFNPVRYKKGAIRP